MSEDEQAASRQQGEKRGIRPQKIYMKDLSFETPNSPRIFLREWKPDLDLEINTSVTQLTENRYEVVVAVTATVSVEGSTAYLAEVHQAGIFQIQGYDPEHLRQVQNVSCAKGL